MHRTPPIARDTLGLPSREGGRLPWHGAPCRILAYYTLTERGHPSASSSNLIQSYRRTRFLHACVRQVASATTVRRSSGRDNARDGVKLSADASFPCKTLRLASGIARTPRRPDGANPQRVWREVAARGLPARSRLIEPVLRGAQPLAARVEQRARAADPRSTSLAAQPRTRRVNVRHAGYGANLGGQGPRRDHRR
jgi:hypothetical protein